MNSLFLDDLSNAPNQDIPAVIPRLIDAAVATFDADPDNSRRYLLRASAILTVRREAGPAAENTGRSESRGGLLTWQLNRMVDYIETHLADRIAAADLANLLNVSAGKLFRAFKVSVGVSPLRYVTKRRVERACTLMRTTREPLSQVAVACGLYDQAHLYRLFRRETGMGPSVWRRAMQSKNAHITRADGGAAFLTAPPYVDPERIGATGICDEVSISSVKHPARSDTARARSHAQMKAVRC
jgi:AraC family transcriptional regulator